MAAIIAPLQLAVGDLLGRTVADHQPATLAAIEGVTHTEHGAGLNVGGFPLPGHNGDVLNVKVPHLLSLLAFDDPNAPVRGLDTLPEGRPHAAARRYVRLAFIGMVGIGTGLVALGLWYWLRRRRGPPGPEDRLTLMAIGGCRPGRVHGQRARLAGQRARTPAVDRLRGVSHLERDHDRARARRDLHRVHAALRRPDRADGLDACAGSPRRPVEGLLAAGAGGSR